jgi:Caspase domain
LAALVVLVGLSGCFDTMVVDFKQPFKINAKRNTKVLVFIPTESGTAGQQAKEAWEKAILAQDTKGIKYEFRYHQIESSTSSSTSKPRWRSRSKRKKTLHNPYEGYDYVIKINGQPDTDGLGELVAFVTMFPALFSLSIIPMISAPSSPIDIPYEIIDAWDNTVLKAGTMSVRQNEIIWMAGKWEAVTVFDFDGIDRYITADLNDEDRQYARRKKMLQKKTGNKKAFPVPDSPPSLEGTVDFADHSGDKILDALEDGTVQVKVVNKGAGTAYGVGLSLEAQGSKDIEIGEMDYAERIKPGESGSYIIKLSGGRNLADGSLPMTLRIDEANGNGAPPVDFIIQTAAMREPILELATYGIDDNSGNARIEPQEIVAVTGVVQNRGRGRAENVTVNVKLGKNVFVAEKSPTRFDLGTIEPGDHREIQFKVYTNRLAKGVPVTISAKETRAGAVMSKALDLPFNVTQQRTEAIVIAGLKKSGSLTAIPNVASLSDPVDTPLATGAKNPDAVAVVIGNSNYSKGDISSVKYARRDAAIMREYLIKTLGYKPGNILFEQDATYATMRAIFGSDSNHEGRLSDLVKEGKSDVFVYYSGHGAPDTDTKDAYFVPVDADPAKIALNGYKLGTFYKNLSKIPARSTTVVVDSCFSSVEGARPVIFEVKAEAFGNATVLTSSGPGQISSDYPEKRHGLFTYFFLKGLRGDADANRDGKITAGEMHAYLSDKTEGVPYWARHLHGGRKQNPQFKGDGDRVILELK